MPVDTSKSDLFVLVADRDILETITSLLNRPKSLNIRQISYEIVRHLGRDGGCRSDWDKLIREGLVNHHKAMLIFDLDGCGGSGSAIEIQEEIETQMSRNNWDDKCRVVVIDPEIEAWVWCGSNEAAEILGWKSDGELREWLREKEMWPVGSNRPPDPKSSMRMALNEKGITPSRSIFKTLGERVGVKNCKDPSFDRFKATLEKWFPPIE